MSEMAKFNEQYSDHILALSQAMVFASIGSARVTAESLEEEFNLSHDDAMRHSGAITLMATATALGELTVRIAKSDKSESLLADLYDLAQKVRSALSSLADQPAANDPVGEPVNDLPA